MKITGISVIFSYEDGTIEDVSNNIPEGIYSDLEYFADCWQEEEESEDEL